jgi:hypothetical protein
MLSVASGEVAAIPVVGPILSIAGTALDFIAPGLLGPSFAQMNARYGQQLQQLGRTPQGRAFLNQQSALRQADINLSRRALGSRILSVPKLVAKPPGGNVSFLSGLGKIFGTVASDVLPVVSRIGAAIHPAATAAGKAATVALDTAGSAAKAVGGAVRAHPVLAAAGAASAAGLAAAGGVMGGGTTAKGKLHPAVKRALGIPHHRRMHVTNTKALHRALRRVKGFEHVAKRVLSITHHRPTKVHFKFRRKRRAA